MKLAILVPLFAAACSGSSSSSAPASGPCVDRSGTYLQSLTQQSGTCGPLADQVFNVDSGSSVVPSTCTNTSTSTADNCSVSFDTSCPGAAGYTVLQHGVGHWNMDGSEASGIVQIQLIENSSGLVKCSSTYDLSIQRK